MAVKVALVLLGLVAVSLAIQNYESLEFRSFQDFMKKYNKQYASEEEKQTRYLNFKETIRRVALKNMNSSAVYGINKFSDMTPQEFRNQVLMTSPIIANRTPRNPSTVLEAKQVSVPTSLDWRSMGAVTAVKNQEQCGSCWAFSATENIESMWILAKKANNESLDLAPQQIVDCDSSDDGCDGGNPPTAYDYVINAGGLESESAYPYTGEDGNCNFNSKSVVAKISNWKYATTLYSETELQSNLVAYGPLSVCVDAANWQDYQSGVMSWEECAFINVLDHCVQLTGYNTESSTNFWWVRNSWGTDWGVEGYIQLEMWKDTCGIAHEATTSIV